MRDEIERRLAFLRAAEALKSTLRSAHLADGTVESTAEHTWRLCLWVMSFDDMLGGIDAHKLLRLCVIHDLGEAISGDIPATQQVGDKSAEEQVDFVTLIAPLPQALRKEFLNLWLEYEAGETPEAVLAKGFDKLETILQHNQGDNPDGFDYAFNLDYGKPYTDRHPLLTAIREILDAETASNI